MTPALRILVSILLAAALAGCASSGRGRGVEGTGFLGDDASRLQKGGADDWMRVYRNPRVNLAAYDKAILDPVTIWGEADESLRKLAPQDRQALANNFYALLHHAMDRYMEMVSEPGPGTLRVRLALTDAQASSRTLDTISTAVPQLRVATNLQGYVTGKPAFTGEAAVAFKVTDSQTGALLTAGADKRVGQKTLGGSTDAWSDVDAAMRYWAELVSYRICVARSLSSCEKPKAERSL